MFHVKQFEGWEHKGCLRGRSVEQGGVFRGDGPWASSAGAEGPRDGDVLDVSRETGAGVDLRSAAGAHRSRPLHDSGRMD